VNALSPLPQLVTTTSEPRSVRTIEPVGGSFCLVTDAHQVDWHERVRATLDSQIENPNFLVWIIVQAEPDASLAEDELRRDVEGWLGQLDADQVFRDRDEPEHTWQTDGLVIRMTAIPKKPRVRQVGVPIVGNPVSGFAYQSGVVSAETGFPVTRWPP